MRTRTVLILLACFGLLLIASLLRFAVGGDGLALPEHPVIWELRGLRVAAGAIVGAALGVGGAMLQSLLRNPLASPDLLGVTSGAGLAVMVVAFLAFRAGEPMPGAGATGAAALVGALGALAVVYAASQRRGLVDPVSLVLVGVIVGLICAAASRLLESTLPPDPARLATRWMFGSLSDETGWGTLRFVALLTVAVIAGAAWLGPSMDAASLSDEEAHAVGVPIGALRLVLFIGSGVLAAGSIVLAGPIGFVGLVAPHAVRLVLGPGHRGVVLGSACVGAALVVLADAAVKSLDLPGGRVPIGVLTSLIGGPVFVMMLRSSRSRGA
ncbi:MAG: iron ABC transporter permease [Phycisphaerales bacterium]|nr:MAG: iron ABC transporter permease [Phycisphaerales bacterium]